jgi:membrane-bound lytic murein transglycosylase B
VVPIVFCALAAVVVLGLVTVGSTDARRSPQIEAPPAASLIADAGLVDASRATGIPRRALAAYVGAARRLEQDDPACRIGWNTLAGIGSSESSHGAFGGATLNRDGVATPSIIGVALDGTGGNRAIGDTDGGDLDGDTSWDRAVGPLQFIPTTWARWGADGDGDGVSNPHDLDDAALAAAQYLCDAGDDLSASDGWSRAVLEYNQSGAYARTVARTATEYAQAL